MKFKELNINIKDYMGRMGPGILVILSIIYKTKVYEGMYWYTDEIHMLQIPEDIEKEIGKIEEYEEYSDIMEHLKKISANYEETAPQLTDIFDSDSDNQEDENTNQENP
jgi:uncharacterized membrane protein